MNRNRLCRALGTGLAAGVLSVFLSLGKPLPVLLSNCAFWAGIALLIVGAFRLVVWLGLFNGVIYSFKKLREVAHTKNYSPRESELGSRPEYEANTQRGPFEHEMLTAAGLWLLLSLLLALFA